MYVSMFVRKIVINLKRKLKFSQNTLVQKNSDNPVQIIFFALFFFFEMFSKRLKNLASFSQLNIISVVNDRSDRSRFPTKPVYVAFLFQCCIVFIPFFDCKLFSKDRTLLVMVFLLLFPLVFL